MIQETHMRREIIESADVAAAIITRNSSAITKLAAHLRRTPPTFVVTCARGSSDHAATIAQYLIATILRLPVMSLPPSIQSIYGISPNLGKSMFLGISQSGKSPDIVQSATAAKASGALVVAIVNNENSPLAQLADVVLPIHAGIEQSVAATKTFIGSLIVVAHLVAAWSEQKAFLEALARLPEHLKHKQDRNWLGATHIFTQTRNVLVLGRGYGLAIAQEAALKLKETCAIHAEAISTAEVQHGPMALAQNHWPIIAFIQKDQARDGSMALLRSLRDSGATIAGAGIDAEPNMHVLPMPSVLDVEPPVIALICMIQSFYLLVEATAQTLGKNPDEPPFLRKVTETI